VTTIGTAAVILSWHDPLRAAEKMITLDILSEGRALVGTGRGLRGREVPPVAQTFG
jgi:alkanesulfonate monooxygenase SsuD/methylene tetrahydromethanopterin reductase-like flavin-dependent oxidoreductase (luciferase family)